VQRGPAPFTKFVLRDHLERGRGRTASCLEEELREVREDARGHRGPRNGGRTTVFAWALCAGPEHFMSVRRWLFLYLAPVFATRLGQMGLPRRCQVVVAQLCRELCRWNRQQSRTLRCRLAPRPRWFRVHLLSARAGRVPPCRSQPRQRRVPSGRVGSLLPVEG
jgi:hypothetical protein